MKRLIFFLFPLVLIFCTPKGPITYKSNYVGKFRSDLVADKGKPKKVVVYPDSIEAYIYIKREEYFGKKQKFKEGVPLVPKKVVNIEHIYYINSEGIIYKYQVWEKRIN